MNIIVKKLNEKEIEQLHLDKWFPWSCEPSVFNWEYQETEQCYFLKGHVKVWFDNENFVEIKAGDFVEFPKGLKCKWEVIQSVEKLYRFLD